MAVLQKDSTIKHIHVGRYLRVGGMKNNGCVWEGGQSDLTYMLEFLGWCVALPYTYGT